MRAVKLLIVAMVVLSATVCYGQVTTTSVTWDSKCNLDAECTGQQEQCIGGRCSCKEGALYFSGTCEPTLTYGAKCTKQIQCSMTGDAALQCKPAVDGDFSTMTCLCSRSYEYDAVSGKCRDTGKRIPSHISKKKMVPNDERDTMRDLIKGQNLSDILNYDHSFSIPEPEILGPIAVTGVFLVLFIVCLCFWSVREPASDRQPGDDYLRNTYGVQATDGTFPTNQGLEQGDTLRKTKLDGGFDGVAFELNNGAGHDNPCFEQSGSDALSHYTSSTEICETSQKDYIAKHAATKDPEGGKKAKIPNEKANMLFAHAAATDPAVSLTGSMDEADVEVAGLYRKFSQPSPQLLRMDSHGKLSPPTQLNLEDVNTKRPHKIELVETPDCTSIDTTIPEDEIREMNEPKKSYLELVTEARQAKEEEESKEEPEETSETEEEDGNTEGAATPVPVNKTQQEASDFIDDVFEPVFATA